MMVSDESAQERTGLCLTNTGVRNGMGAGMAKAGLKLVAFDDAAEGAANCKALGRILDRIADKWSIMVVGVLSHGPMRFNALQRSIPGISHRMLTLTLRGLERDGLVKRIAFATIPPRVDYELTACAADTDLHCVLLDTNILFVAV